MMLDKRQTSLLKIASFEYLPVLFGLEVESLSLAGLRFLVDLKFLRMSLLLLDFYFPKESYLDPKKLDLFFCSLVADFSISFSTYPNTHLKKSLNRSLFD